MQHANGSELCKLQPAVPTAWCCTLVPRQCCIARLLASPDCSSLQRPPLVGSLSSLRKTCSHSGARFVSLWAGPWAPASVQLVMVSQPFTCKCAPVTKLPGLGPRVSGCEALVVGSCSCRWPAYLRSSTLIDGWLPHHSLSRPLAAHRLLTMIDHIALVCPAGAGELYRPGYQSSHPGALRLLSPAQPKLTAVALDRCRRIALPHFCWTR